MGKSNFQVTRQIATRRRTTSHVPSRSRVQCGCAGADPTPLERFLESPEIPVASSSFRNGLYGIKSNSRNAQYENLLCVPSIDSTSSRSSG